MKTGLPYKCSVCGGEFVLRPGRAAALVNSYRCCQCGDSPHSPEQGIAWKHKTVHLDPAGSEAA